MESVFAFRAAAWMHEGILKILLCRRLPCEKAHFVSLNLSDKRGIVPAMIHEDALLLREATGTSAVVEAARSLAATLAHFEIAHLIVGGLAVQEHGYPRVTIDVDIVVPDVLEAVEFGTADLASTLGRVQGTKDRIQDRRTGVIIDILPAGKVLKAGCKVPFPFPSIASDELQFATLEQLISLKLDSWANSPWHRLRDQTDVVELVLRRKLPRSFAVDDSVRESYLKIWDGLQAEK
jgi:hypothetical protein